MVAKNPLLFFVARVDYTKHEHIPLRSNLLLLILGPQDPLPEIGIYWQVNYPMWVTVHPVGKPGLTGADKRRPICRSLGGFTFQPSIGSTDAQNGNTANMAILQSKSKWSCSSSTVCLYVWLRLHNNFHTIGIISMIFCCLKCYIHSTQIFIYKERERISLTVRFIFLPGILFPEQCVLFNMDTLISTPNVLSERRKPPDDL